MAPSTELPHDFCAGISPLQLGVVLVFFKFRILKTWCIETFIMPYIDIFIWNYCYKPQYTDLMFIFIECHSQAGQQHPPAHHAAADGRSLWFEEQEPVAAEEDCGHTQAAAQGYFWWQDKQVIHYNQVISLSFEMTMVIWYKDRVLLSWFQECLLDAAADMKLRAKAFSRLLYARHILGVLLETILNTDSTQ